VRAKIPTSSAPKVALVLAGGAARGAYEVGVIQYLVEEVSRDLGRNVPLPILCGTSVGAINACTMAAYADEPVRRAHLMVRYWTKLRIEDILLPGPSDFMGMMRLALGFGHRRLPAQSHIRFGPVPSTTATGQRAQLTTLPFVPSHSNGSVSSFAAGSTAYPTTNLATSPRFGSAIPQSSNSPPRLHNLLAVRLRARVRQSPARYV
jgi:predicted acylesterase/phospholipase RssA